MQVTGLVVNAKINVDRKYMKKIRAMLHDCEKNGLEKASIIHFKLERTKENKFEYMKLFLQRLRGSIAFIGQIRGYQDTIFLHYSSQLQIIEKSDSY